MDSLDNRNTLKIINLERRGGQCFKGTDPSI